MRPRLALICSLALMPLARAYADADSCLKAAMNHGDQIRCEARLAKEDRSTMDKSLRRALECARRSHSEGNPDFTDQIRSSQHEWESYVSDECNMEGMADGGASAPQPGEEGCEQRLLSSRADDLRGLCEDLGVVE